MSSETSRLSQRLATLVFVGVIVVVAAHSSYSQSSSGQALATVVVYSSEDRACAEPILEDFERDTGIHVAAVYDKEAAGYVMKRLIDEKGDPQADAYWANEPIHPDQLKGLGITEPYISPKAAAFPAMFKDPGGHWTAFSARARVLVVNAKAPIKPDSILAYADARWSGKAILANPLLNTTAFNLTALFNVWGEQRGWEFLNKVKNNGVRISVHNPDSALAVASGRAEFSLVDIDDALAAVHLSPGVEVQYPDQEENGLGCFMVANAVALIRGGRHPDTARRLIDYLLSAETQRKLAFSPCAQTPLSRGVKVPSTVRRIEELRVMPVSYSEIRQRLEGLRPGLKAWSSQ
jgi:iron(III) transport system substrate-binding protein